MNHVILTLLSAGHVILILLIVVLLFGGKKIPELMKGVGQGIKELKNGMNGDEQPNQEKQSEPKRNTSNDKPLF